MVSLREALVFYLAGWRKRQTFIPAKRGSILYYFCRGSVTSSRHCCLCLGDKEIMLKSLNGVLTRLYHASQASSIVTGIPFDVFIHAVLVPRQGRDSSQEQTKVFTPLRPLFTPLNSHTTRQKTKSEMELHGARSCLIHFTLGSLPRASVEKG